MFELYQEEKSTLPFRDYGTLKNMVGAADARRVLEFGPGYSTLALIEGGAKHITSCECHGGYRDLMRALFKPHGQVTIVPFTDVEPVAHAELPEHEQYDLAFVDSPRGKEEFSRLNTVLCAIERSPIVMLHDVSRHGEQMTLQYVEDKGHYVELLPGANMALIVRVE